jgi:hypothetical protein
MRLRKIAAYTASVFALLVIAFGISAPANAQGRHGGGGGYSGGGHSFSGGHGGYGGGGHESYGGGGWGGGNHGGYGGGGYHHGWGGGSGYHSWGGASYDYHPYYHHRAWGPDYAPGPGYAWHSWGWYEDQPYEWRAHHPYHGSPSIGIWIHL